MTTKTAAREYCMKEYELDGEYSCHVCGGKQAKAFTAGAEHERSRLLNAISNYKELNEYGRRVVDWDFLIKLCQPEKLKGAEGDEK